MICICYKIDKELITKKNKILVYWLGILSTPVLTKLDSISNKNYVVSSSSV